MMTGPLAALTRAYELRRQWTLDMPVLGLPGASRGAVGPDRLPASVDGDFSSKTKSPVFLSVRYGDGDAIHPVKPITGFTDGRDTTRDLIMLGVHPLDIILGTWDYLDGSWTFRTSVDHLYWTRDDQMRLDESHSGTAP